MAKRRRKRVPETKPKFDNYQKDSTTHLETGTPARGIELGLSTTELDAWKAFRDAWVLLYPKYTDKTKRTTSITKDVNKHMKDFGKFAEPLLIRMSGSSVLTTDDRTILNLPERDKTPTAKGKIEDVPTVDITALGGGQMKFRVRTAEDATRASMHEDADFIEVKYMIQGNEVTPPPPPDGKDTILPTVDKATNYTISKKALFVVELGTTNTGKVLIAFVRYANASNPANSGPWTLPKVAVIL